MGYNIGRIKRGSYSGDISDTVWDTKRTIPDWKQKTGGWTSGLPSSGNAYFLPLKYTLYLNVFVCLSDANIFCSFQPLQQEEGELDALDGYEEEESYQTYEETTVTSTDQVMSSVEEERSTFVITSVTDPRDDDKELSLQEAIILGIIDQTTNQYINPDTGDVCSITAAMNDGKIMFEFTSRKKIREEKKSYGIISIKTTKENRPYTISHVIDPSSEQEMTLPQAISKGIINKTDSTYRTETGELISIDDAISSGLVKVEYHNGGDHPEAESTTRTYAVHGVLDKKTNQKVSFADALSSGILDKESGEYVDNVTKDRLPVQDAIMKGFIKARIVTDTSKLDIDPENKMVVEKFASAKNKLRAAKALRGMNNGQS